MKVLFLGYLDKKSVEKFCFIGSQPHIDTTDIDQFPEACTLNILKFMEIETHGMHIYYV